MRTSRSIRPAPRKALETRFRELELVVEVMDNCRWEDDGGKRLSGSGCCRLQRCGTSFESTVTCHTYFQIGEGGPEESERSFKIKGAEFFWVLILGLNLRSRRKSVLLFFFSATEIKIRQWPLNIISHSPMPYNIPSPSRHRYIPLTTSPNRSPPSNTRTSS